MKHRTSPSVVRPESPDTYNVGCLGVAWHPSEKNIGCINLLFECQTDCPQAELKAPVSTRTHQQFNTACKPSNKCSCVPLTVYVTATVMMRNNQRFN